MNLHEFLEIFLGILCLLTSGSPLQDFGAFSHTYKIPSNHAKVPHRQAHTLTRAVFAELCESQNNATPLVISDMIQHWPAMQQKLTKQQLADMAGRHSISFAVQQGRQSKQYSDFLADFVSHLHESTHENAFYAVMEDLLFRKEPGAEELLNMLGRGKIPLFEEDGGNLFKLFPEALQPPSRALVLGGQGAKSSVHVDPYNWTGWNALLRGRKLWRFWPPSVPASHMQAFRSPTRSELEATPGLLPFIPSEFRSDVDSFFTSSLQPDWERFSAFKQAWPPFMEVIQRPGEVVVIPPGWWHQVYHLTDSIGFASQFASIYNYHSIIGTIFEWNSISWEQCAEPNSTALSPSNITIINASQATYLLNAAISCAQKHHAKLHRTAADLPRKEDEL